MPWLASRGPPEIDFAAHAAALGAQSERVMSLEQLPQALARPRESQASYAIVIETGPVPSTAEGGAW